MKKVILIVIGLFAVSTIVSAQGLKKDIFGVRAGLNLANVSMYSEGLIGKIELDTDSKTNFHVGFSYQHLLIPATPLYLETGLYFTQKGFKYFLDFSKYMVVDPNIELYYVKANSNSMYFQVPLLLNYHFAVAKNITIQPFAGLYLAYGIGGKTKTDNGEKKISEKSFGDDGYERFDLGIRAGIGATFGKIYMSIGYEPGLINISADTGEGRMKNENWAFTIGYNF
jgi:hypothetical protein